MSEIQVLTGPAIRYFHLVALKQAVKLEKQGMTHSSGKSAKTQAEFEFGLAESSFDEVLIKLEQELRLALAARLAEVQRQQI